MRGLTVVFGAMALPLMLGGCMLSAPDRATRAAPERVLVAGNAVVVAGPPGFCVDLQGSRDLGVSAFVLLGNCASIANQVSLPQPDMPAFLTASVARTPDTSVVTPEALAAYFRSDAGRAQLSPSGDASLVEIRETRAADGVFYIHARAAASQSLTDLDEDHWRAIFAVNDTIVTVALRGLGNLPIRDEARFATLESFATRIRDESRQRSQALAQNPAG